MGELTTFCELNGLAIVHDQDNNEFFEIPEVEQKKKMTNHETYLQKRAVKGEPCPYGKPLICNLLVSI
ncbi:agamous-like MADS-box protein AGL36 [Pyrus ussuriensis x Pyrus communis]|uniref:Agamous-like MADS-box protein AGL36 n=1 Tax=Pyrus ussuriensis x Pyrus communis TaxID=2448454 RepID=A0A5N5FYQ1_9ROSA|nr:agamous-like MADS-box protein AGL36 [Pyrus ussuriensis x Pyrus communis]